ncbi:MAG: DUF1559 domain-containing protein [Planctomycetaceae bacterium]|nr:DUF1559 domain-containing protein [Planctomycetaceae bacterium]
MTIVLPNQIRSIRFRLTVILIGAAAIILAGIYYWQLRQVAIHVSRQAQCNSNHATIVSMLLRYHVQTGKYPADVLSADGTPLLSWRVELLSILDPKRYAAFDLTQPWNSKHNLKAMFPTPQWYRCPGQSIRGEMHCSSYYFVRPQRGKFDEPGDTESTYGATEEAMDCVAIVEAEGLEIPWSCPGDLEGDSCRHQLVDPDRATTACGRSQTPFGVRLSGERVILNRN